jgi:hypothetical protein
MACLVTGERRFPDNSADRVEHALIAIGEFDRKPLEDQSSRSEASDHRPDFRRGALHGRNVAARHTIDGPCLKLGSLSQDLVDAGLYRWVVEQGHENDSTARVCRPSRAATTLQGKERIKCTDT